MSSGAMDLARCLVVLVTCLFDSGETGGYHGGHHHDHLRIHLPEFIHHGHHTKVITVHHHHHKPNQQHHHHHHHHHPPKHLVIPYGHHYHHKKTHHVSEGHSVSTGQHGNHGHIVGPRPHIQPHSDSSGYGHHPSAHHLHSYKYQPSSSPLGNDIGSYSPAVPYGGGVPHSFTANVPQVHGVQHTLKQVKVFDSLPAAVPNAGPSPGYEVTEEGQEQEEDDTFTSVNSLHEEFPDTYGYLSEADTNPELQDPFAEQPFKSLQSHDSFSPPQLTSISADGIESYTSQGNIDPFELQPTSDAIPSAPAASPDLPVSFDTIDFHDAMTSFPGEAHSTYQLGDDTSADREAGIQHSVHTSGIQTVNY